LKRRRDEAMRRGEPPKYDRTCLRLPAAESAARAAKGEPHAIRFRIPEGETSWEDGVRGNVTFQNAARRPRDSEPTATRPTISRRWSDRHGNTRVLRGDDHISNTPRQIQTYRALATRHPTSRIFR
jgi:glutamyl/glutaminyl-tRNA synthetase